MPISEVARAAIDRQRERFPAIGRAPLFPAPNDPTQPIKIHAVRRWLRLAEDEVGLKPLQGSLFHAYRRKWASERQHLPDVAVRDAGGWVQADTMKRCYQQADEEQMYEAVSNPRRRQNTAS